MSNHRLMLCIQKIYTFIYVENSAIFVSLNYTATLISGYNFRDILLWTL